MSARQDQTVHLCGSISSLSQTQQAHSHLLKTGYDTYVANKPLSLYANHQRFTDAKSLLLSLPNPNIFYFKALIDTSSKSNLFNRTLHLFSRLVSSYILPDVHILPSDIKACAGLSFLDVGKQVHGFGLNSGLVLDSFVEASLVHMYVKCNQLKSARKVFDRILYPDVVSWSALIDGYAKRGDVINFKMVFDGACKFAIEPNHVSWNGMIAGFNQSGWFSNAILMFQRMNSEGTSISNVLHAIGDLEDCKMGVQVHGLVNKLGFESDDYVVSALVDMYGKCRCTLQMSKVFERDYLGAFNALVAGL